MAYPNFVNSVMEIPELIFFIPRIFWDFLKVFNIFCGFQEFRLKKCAYNIQFQRDKKYILKKYKNKKSVEFRQRLRLPRLRDKLIPRSRKISGPNNVPTR